MNLVGRHREKEILEQCVVSKMSHFIAIYGRRRVGKTFLIRQFFENKFDFYVTGLAHGDLSSQLINFSIALKHHGQDESLKEPRTWLEAFNLLIQQLKRSQSKKKVIFIDELPWMDTPRSKFLMGLEYFWNSWASGRNDILLIGCGSAASWMINNLINNKGGLYNRVTRRIKLSPFTLSEVEQFLVSRKYHIDKYQIAQLYMAFGGIPYYLDLINPKYSVAQNIQQLFFTQNAQLQNEYEILFKSLFEGSETHKKIIEALTIKKTGLTRKEILKHIELKDGGGISRAISELMHSDFIRQYTKFGNRNRDSIYQLTDPFTLFHHRFIANYHQESNFWINQINTPRINSWQGNAFEIICLLHVDAIKSALGIAGIQSSASTWWGEGAQIDLVIDRMDQVINLIEIKFSVDQYTIDKNYDERLRKKLDAFRQETQTRKALWTTMLTTYGLKVNMYSGNVQRVLVLEDLFLKK